MGGNSAKRRSVKQRQQQQRAAHVFLDDVKAISSAKQGALRERVRFLGGCAAQWLWRISRDKENWWFFIFATACLSYAMLLRAYATPPVVQASLEGLFQSPPRLLAQLETGLDGCAWRGDHLIFAEPAKNRLWRHEVGRGVVRIGHSFFLGAAGCQGECDARIPGAVCVADLNVTHLILCEQGSRRVTMLAADGSRKVLAADLEGPNEAVVVENVLYFLDVYRSSTGSAVTANGSVLSRRRTIYHSLYETNLDSTFNTRPLPVNLKTPEALVALDNTRLIIGDGNSLFSYDISSRRQIKCPVEFQHPITSVVVSPSTVSPRHLFLASGPEVVALDATCGSVTGRVNIKTRSSTSLALGNDDHLYIATSDGCLLYISLSD